MKFFLSLIFSLSSVVLFAAGNANVTITTSATSNGSWSALSGGTYTFTPSANTANVLASEIVNRMTGSGFTAGNVTILTACSGTGTQSGNVTISTAITAASAARIFTITAAGTVTVSSAVNLTASAGNQGGRISFSGTTGVSVGAALTTTGSSPGTPGSNATGGAGGNISLTSTSGTVSVTSALTAQGAAGGTGGSASGGAGGAITISGTSVSISAAGTINTVGGSGPGYNGGAGGAVAITSSTSSISVSSSITTSGGNAGSANIIGYRGGNAGAVTFTAYTTLSTGNITANGGTNGGYYYHCGGNGGVVTLRGTSVSNGAISTVKGTSGGGVSASCNSNGSTTNCTRGNVGAQSSSAAVTKNILITPITHSTSLITAVGTPSGLPPGLSASYASNTITISGTPTSGGTYNYSWTPTTSSSCGATTISGTIIVNEILPVEFISFEANLIDDFVELIWQTASEVNNEKFIIEKSFDGENWFTIAEVIGAGNSNSILNYSYIDNEVSDGIQYYRLTQIDFDGAKESSKIVNVSKSSSRSFEVQVYPNPMKEEVQVSFVAEKLGESRIKIYSEIGQELYNSVMLTAEGNNTFTFNSSQLSEGIYFINVERENGMFCTMKVIK